jgi:acetyl esterase/lipase
MRTKFTYLIAFLFAINNFAQTNPCITIVNDTFDEAGALPSDWTEYNTSGRVTVEAGKLKFEHNTTRPSVYRTFTPTSNNSTFSFDVSSSRNSVNCQIHLVSSTGKYLSSMSVGVQSASIKYATSILNGVPSGFTDGTPLVGLTTNTVYALSAEIDFNSKTVDFYSDGALMAKDIPFLEAAEDIAKIDIQSIYMYSNNGQFYFDNFSLLSGAANRLLLTRNTTAAETLINAAAIGTDYDQYPQSAIDAFQTAINNANLIVENCDATSVSIDTALSDLKTAQNIFLAARINGLVLSLENAKGIIADNLGSVIRWENQIEGFGDATQSDTNLGAEESQETYPGKTTVLFNKEGSFLELEGSNTYISDNNYSIFYVGKANPDGKPASLIGNYDITGTFATCKGIRLLKGSDGSIFFDYAKPNYVRTTLSTIGGDGFFFLGFTMDSSGNYSYFDSSSPIITTGKINDTMVLNSEDMNLNLLEEKDIAATYGQTEVVEVAMYDLALDATKFQNEYNRLATEYAELVKAEFSVTDVLPAKRTGLPATSDIVINFSQNVDDTSEYPKIFVNKSDTEAAGTWSLSAENTLTFSPAENWPENALVSLQIQEGLKSTDDVFIGLASGNTYNFIVAPEKVFAYESYELEEPIATVDFPIVGHKLPLKLTTPIIDENTKEKFPVHIWVHGGGWSGGSAETSNAVYSPHGDYLAENLGIATLGIAYRCAGSSGTFSLAREDVQTAYDWALANAEKYNLDMTKVFFSGGSAGAPLGAIGAEENNALGFIGFNGIYDFVNDAGDFGTGNWYKQNVPSEALNSPINLLSNTPTSTILMHGDADTTINIRQSTLFTDAINAKGGDGTTIVYPGEVHAFFNLNKPAYEDVLIEMVGFINRILNQQSLSVSEIDDEDKIMIYPNPVKKGDDLNFHLNSNFNNKKIETQIINYLGQTILKTTLFPIKNSINITTKNLNKGVYFLKIANNNNIKTVKFIVK